MPKKPYSKIRTPFLEGYFPENPLPYKKLNRKNIKTCILSNRSNKKNRKGLASRIRNIQKNIIYIETVSKNTQKTSFKNLSYTSLLSVRSFLSPRIMSNLYVKKQKEYLKNTQKAYRKPITTKYIFSLHQLQAEFQKKQSQYRKNSHFKNLLFERKKCSLIYGCLGEKQMQKLINMAKHFDGKFDENFIKIVESRLDVALYRICFFCNIFSARQWINHGHVLVNKKKVYLPGYTLKGGDVISISAEKKNLLKKNIYSLIAQKLRIRSVHYLVNIKSFYTIVKNLVKYQNINYALYLYNKNLSTKVFDSFRIQQKIDNKKKPINLRAFLHFQEYRKVVNFFKNTFYTVKKSIYKNKIYNSLYLLPKMYPFFVFFVFPKTENTKNLLKIKLFSIFYPFLKVRNLFTIVRPIKQRVKGFKISGIKPLNLEVCYKNMVAIFLYSPQKVALPTTIDLHLIGKTSV